MVLFLLYLFSSAQVVNQMIEICKLFLFEKMDDENIYQELYLKLLVFVNNVQNLFF